MIGTRELTDEKIKLCNCTGKFQGDLLNSVVFLNGMLFNTVSFLGDAIYVFDHHLGRIVVAYHEFERCSVAKRVLL